MLTSDFPQRTSVALIVTLLLATPALAQPGGRGGFGGGPGGGLTGLLASPEVQAEIELMDDQRADLEAMGEELRDEMRSMFADMRDLSPEERRERFQTMREDMQAIQHQAEDRLQDILLPHQFARLREINLQQQIQQRGVQGALAGDLAQELGITEEQRQRLAEKAQEVQREMQEKIQQLRKEAEEELLSVLTPDQRARLESLMGSEFQLQQRGLGGPGGRFGGREGRGNRGRPQRGD